MSMILSIVGVAAKDENLLYPEVKLKPFSLMENSTCAFFLAWYAAFRLLHGVSPLSARRISWEPRTLTFSLTVSYISLLTQ
jgi:hypothetical protein